MSSFWLHLPMVLISVAQAAPVDDGPDPGLAIFALIMIAAMLMLIGVGIVVGLFCIILLAGLMAVGIVSSATFVGLVRRRWSAGMRAVFYQICAVLCTLAGVAMLCMGKELLDWQFPWRWVVLIGVAAGIGAGLAVAGVLDFMLKVIYRRLMRRYLSLKAAS